MKDSKIKKPGLKENMQKIRLKKGEKKEKKNRKKNDQKCNFYLHIRKSIF